MKCLLGRAKSGISRRLNHLRLLGQEVDELVGVLPVHRVELAVHASGGEKWAICTFYRRIFTGGVKITV